MHTAQYIADCLINLSDQSEQGDMTNMKLQKLLYYCQGTALALFNKPLFKEEIRKWQYGPVVPDVYHRFKKYGSNVLELGESDFSGLSELEHSLIEDVYNFFGQFSAIKLMNLTHNESPWINVEMGEIIPHDSLKEFFDTIVNKEN